MTTRTTKLYFIIFFSKNNEFSHVLIERGLQKGLQKPIPFVHYKDHGRMQQERRCHKDNIIGLGSNVLKLLKEINHGYRFRSSCFSNLQWDPI
jgi:hypothetical protein